MFAVSTVWLVIFEAVLWGNMFTKKKKKSYAFSKRSNSPVAMFTESETLSQSDIEWNLSDHDVSIGLVRAIIIVCLEQGGYTSGQEFD